MQRYWDARGVCEEASTYPDDFGQWKVGDPSSDKEISARESVETMMGGGVSVVSTKLLAEHLNTTIEVTLSDGRIFVHRWANPPLEEASLEWMKRKFAAEVGVLRLLEKFEGTVSPRVLAVSPDPEKLSFAMEKLPGVISMNCYGSLTADAKTVAVTSYASAALALFKIPVPTVERAPVLKIGTLTPDAHGGYHMSPLISLLESHTTIYRTVEEYIDGLIDATFKKLIQINTSESTQDKPPISRAHLERLGRLLRTELSSLPKNLEYMWRPVLRHDDAREANVLLDPESGRVTGIIDWEFHSVQPAVLAVHYPPFLNFDGPDDPRFAPPGTYWMADFDELRQSRKLYEQIIEKTDPDMYECLVRGRNLRAGIQWLSILGAFPFGCGGMVQWMDLMFGESS